MAVTQVDTDYPIYIGVSKKFFKELRTHGRLHEIDKVKFTDSMKEAEEQARAAAQNEGEEVGMVIKFDTRFLLEHPVFSKQSSNNVIDHIFRYIVGFYEIVIDVIFGDDDDHHWYN